jgi:glutaryl-CoA dehydrogenase
LRAVTGVSDHARMTASPLDRLDFLNLASQLGADELAVRDSVARFVDEQVLPVIRENFEQHSFPRGLIPQLAALGVFGAQLEGYGCAGLGAVACGLIAQELERGDSAIRSFYSVQSSLCMFPIHHYGSELQRQRWLPGMARGEIIGCFGLTEAQGGSDPANLRTHARRNGGDWVLSGSKMWITNGSIADIAIIWAQTDEGLQGFLVERGMPGFSSAEIENKFSLRASVTSALFLDSVRVPDANLLPGCIGLKGPLSCLTQARYGICWGVVGAAQACLAQLLDYTAARELFGRVLAQNQAVQVRLAEMSRQISSAQLMALQLARLKDAGTLAPAQVSMVKWHNCRVALDVARDCRDLLGGAGISAEYVPIRHMLNLESVITYEGTETIHQLAVGRELTGLNAF